jgi:hypothetical protein
MVAENQILSRLCRAELIDLRLCSGESGRRVDPKRLSVFDLEDIEWFKHGWNVSSAFGARLSVNAHIAVFTYAFPAKSIRFVASSEDCNPFQFSRGPADKELLSGRWGQPRVITIALLGFICFLFAFFLHLHHFVSNLVNNSGI